MAYRDSCVSSVLWALPALTLLFGGGCGSDDESSAGGAGGGTADGGSSGGAGGGAGLTSDAAAPGEAYRLATYNSGLALTFVDYAAERAPLAARATAAEAADLLCVQEFWEQEHWDALVAAASDKPNTLRLDPLPGGAGGTCTPAEMDPLEVCVTANCPPSVDLTSCTLEQCPDEVNAVSPGCLDCLIANVGSGDLAVIRAACAGTGSSDADAGTESPFAYGGSFGIGLLSDRPFSTSDDIVLDSSLTRRGVLYAQIDDTPIGTVHAFCTHLTAQVSVPYNGDFVSYEAEQAAQIDRMLEWVGEKTRDGDTVILLGDFNTGPAATDAVAAFPDNYDKFVTAGLSSHYAESDGATCTFCPENPLTGDGSGVLIDHVLTRGFAGSTESERFLTEDVDIEVAGTGTVTTRHSDHYGVRVTVRP